MTNPVQRMTVNGADLGYAVHGAGADKLPLVFVHGAFSRSTEGPYGELLALLAQRFVVYALDLRGHGASADALEGWTLDGLADDIVAFSRQLELDRPVYVGHSLSTFIGLLAEIRHPGSFSAMCLLTPGPADPRKDPVEGLDLLIAHRPDEATIRARTRFLFMRPPGEVLGQMVDAMALIDVSVFRSLREQNGLVSIDDRLPDVAAPVLLVCGERDVVIPPARQHEMARKLGRCKEVVFSNEGHLLPNESAPVAAREILAFLEFDCKAMLESGAVA